MQAKRYVTQMWAVKMAGTSIVDKLDSVQDPPMKAPPAKRPNLAELASCGLDTLKCASDPVLQDAETPQLKLDKCHMAEKKARDEMALANQAKSSMLVPAGEPAPRTPVFGKSAQSARTHH